MTHELTSEKHTTRVPTLRMAAAAGVAVASIYYNQPMLGLITREFPRGGAEALIPTVTQLGYALGLILLVPLGDLFERRRLLLVQFGLLSAALALTALAPTLALLVIASVLVGATATVAQQVVPFAAHLASAERRGSTVGTVMAGLLGGILLSRTVAGLVAGALGFRAMFWCAVPLVAVIGLMTTVALPRSPPEVRMPYGQLLRSLAALWTELAELRWAALTQALLFAGFSAFWTTLAFRLEQPPFRLGPAAAGAFGMIGLVGVLAAPIAGRAADTRGPQQLIVFGAATTALSFLVFGVAGSLTGLIVGVILLDFGAQVALVAHQHIIYALRPEARSRLNSVFMAVMFVGGAAGSLSSTALFRYGGFGHVVGLGVGTSISAMALRLWVQRARRAAHAG